MQINRAPGPQINAGYGSRGLVPGPQTRPQNLAPNHPQYLHPGIQHVPSKVQIQPKTAPGPQIFPRKAPGPEEVARVKRAYVKKANKGPLAPLPPGMTISQNQVLKNTGSSGMKIMKNQVVRISIHILKSLILIFIPDRGRSYNWPKNCGFWTSAAKFMNIYQFNIIHLIFRWGQMGRKPTLLSMTSMKLCWSSKINLPLYWLLFCLNILIANDKLC